MIERSVEYRHEGTTLQGLLCHAGSATGKRPAVLVSHAWAGRSDFENDKARALAALGYVGFALDLYGKGVLGANTEENSALMRPFLDNRGLLQGRLLAALEVVQAQPEVDPGRIAAIGYCFGGLCVLDLARSGAEVRGVVSFHGLLGKPGLPKHPVKSKVLVLHGHDDPMVPVADVVSFQEEMTRAGVDWQVHTYGHTLHAFTNPEAHDPAFGVQYNLAADRRSWASMLRFLEEVLA